MTKLAYVIGNNDYKNWSNLNNPINDINGIGDVLTNVGFTVRRFTNLGYSGMSQCIYDFGHELINHNVGLFYFAGHGVEFQGENYLIPIDASNDSERTIISSSVNISLIFSWMSSYQENTNIVILDACRTNISYPGSRGLVKTGLIPIGGPSGTFISYSTSPGSIARDGNGNNSLFAEALMRFIPSEGEKIEDIFKKVRNHVQQESNGEQLPWDLTSLLGDFYFIEPRHIFSIAGITPQIIFDYAESIWDDFEKQFNTDVAEALVFIAVSKHFNLPLLEVFRGYSIIQNKNYYSFSDSELCALGIERFRDIGFIEKNGRWYYEGTPIRMGEIFPLPPDMETLPPEDGQEIDVDITISVYFDGNSLIIQGTSNLSEGMLLMLSFRNLETNYFAQDKVSISDNEFISHGFTNRNEKISAGNYILQLSSPIFSVQPDEVKPYLGNRCRNLIGKLIEFNVIGGNTINYVEQIAISY